MSQPTPKADQLRALREAKFSKRGTDAQTNIKGGAVRKSSVDSSGGVPAIVQHHIGATKKVAKAGKGKAKGKAAKRGKKQTVRKQGPADR